MNLLNKILDTLRVPHTNFYVNKLYREHPFKDTFWGLSKMLSSYNIPNNAFHFTNIDDIYLIDTPFVAQVGSEFVLVNKIDGGTVLFCHNDKYQSITLEEFKNQWTGKALLFETSQDSVEPNYIAHKVLFRLSIIIRIVVASAFIYCCFYTLTRLSASMSVNIGLLLFSSFGLFCSYSLCRKELKIADRYGDKLCSLFKKANCNSVIESSAAKIANKYSLSAIGVGYFISSLLLCTIEVFQFPLFIIDCIAVLFTLWSFGYQKFKLHQYCLLCLIICGCIWGNLFCYIYSVNNFIFDIFTFAFVGAFVLLIMYVTAMGFIYLSKSKEMQMKVYRLQSIKHNDLVFSSLLKNQKHYDLDNVSRIVLGNPQGSITVTILSNLHCQPCKKMHSRMCEVIGQNREIRLVYIYSSFNEALEDSTKCLLYNYIHHPKEYEVMLEKWYRYGMYHRRKFYNEYPYDDNDIDTNEEILKHTNWKISNNVSATPTVFVNGYLLPQEYSVEDLINITELK